MPEEDDWVCDVCYGKHANEPVSNGTYPIRGKCCWTCERRLDELRQGAWRLSRSYRQRRRQDALRKEPHDA